MMEGQQYCITVPELPHLPDYEFGAILDNDAPKAFNSIDDAVKEAQRSREHVPRGYHFEIRKFRDNREHPALKWYCGPYDIGKEILKIV